MARLTPRMTNWLVGLGGHIAIGLGGIGNVRDAYQFKGEGRLGGDVLVITIDEICSTKPSPEAGLRLDVLPYDNILAFESSRSADDGPPRQRQRQRQRGANDE